MTRRATFTALRCTVAVPAAELCSSWIQRARKLCFTVSLGRQDGANPVASLVRDTAGNPAVLTQEWWRFRQRNRDHADTTGTETVLYSFAGTPDGANPVASLVRDTAGNLYGTTQYGGPSGSGTVFKLDTTGKETVLYSFTGTPDGANPVAGLIRGAAGNFYGTTYYGGTSGNGTVFKLDANGKETLLHSFLLAYPTDGSNPAPAWFGTCFRALR